MDHRPQGRVADYTLPFLVVAGVLVFFILLTVWGIWGYHRALALAGVVWLGLRVTSA